MCIRDRDSPSESRTRPERGARLRPRRPESVSYTHLAPLSLADFIRALQFPESPDDRAGFRALRLALEDRNVAKLIRAAQDVLTLLSQEGIYMDDLKPDRARPEVWRLSLIHI